MSAREEVVGMENSFVAVTHGEHRRRGMTGMELTAENISALKALVYDRCHLSFPRGRESQLRRWFTQHAEEGQHRSFEDYYRAISTKDGEFERLISLITTRETYFFRMPEQFDVLRERVLPEIIDGEGKRAMKALSRGESYRTNLRVWSAGCASGQETYSLAMQILATIRYAKAWDIRVLGTDINREGIEIAKTGRYERMRLGKTPPQMIERYLEPRAASEVWVADEVKEIADFQVLNLRDLPRMESFKNYFDIIFCRNVMIYFDLPAQQGLVSALSDCLKPGGYLFTGEGEVLHLYEHTLEIVEQGESIYYRKAEE